MLGAAIRQHLKPRCASAKQKPDRMMRPSHPAPLVDGGPEPRRPEAVKFFVSNAPGGYPGERLVYVGRARWPIEECFKQEKDELGFGHLEVRG
jgi:SRSO17 transposase